MYNPHLKLDFSYFVMERSRKMAPHDGMGDVLRKAYFSVVLYIVLHIQKACMCRIRRKHMSGHALIYLLF